LPRFDEAADAIEQRLAASFNSQSFGCCDWANTAVVWTCQPRFQKNGSARTLEGIVRSKGMV
jgi:hypothetical protein